MFRIGIEDLAANAFISILSRGGDERFLRFKTLLDYGMRVIDRLERDTGEEATLIHGRENNAALFDDHADFFERFTDRYGYDGIRLKDGKTAHDLVLRFIGVIPVEVQDAISNTKFR